MTPTSNDEGCKTPRHDARKGLALMMLRHRLSGRAMKLITAIMAQTESDGRWRQPLENATTYTGQSPSTATQARAELIRCGLICRDPHDPLSWWLAPEVWFTGSQRQLARHRERFQKLASKPQRSKRFQGEVLAS